MARTADNKPGSPDGRLILATTSLFLAGLAGIGAVIAGFGTRLGLWRFPTGFTLLRYGGVLALAAALLALAALVLAWRDRRFGGMFLALVALGIGGVTVALPVSWWIKAKRLPPIHDITTDTKQPPQFVALLPLRPAASNTAEYGGPEVARQQQEAYPDIKSLLLQLPADQVFARSAAIARELGWRIVAEEPREGRLEATTTSFWFGFTDDIVVRITPAGYRCLVDIRSVSRVGRSDVGANAARIREFLGRLGSGG
jgi:uncharacterized protein (DUF1499 family)